MRILIVGSGHIGQQHARNLKALDPSTELAVWRQRPDPPGWQPPAGVPVDRWLRDCSEVVAWHPEAAIIANPASLHVRTALFLAGLGAHLFIEKPIGTGAEDGLLALGEMPPIAGLIRECDRRGLVLMVGYDLRFYRPLQLVKEALQQGHIGRPLHIRCEVGQYLPDWRPGRDYRTSVSARSELGGGVLLELSHEIDYARWLMGEVASVSAMTGRLSDLGIDVEDTADILLRFQSGAIGSIHLDMVDRAPMRRCRVVGAEGSLEVNLLTWEAWLCKAEGRRQLHYRAGAREDPMLAEMRHFLACCRGEAVPVVGGEGGRRVLDIALAARRSAAEKREVMV